MLNTKDDFLSIWEQNNLQKHSRYKDTASFLEVAGFFSAPASIGYHGSYDGGLLDHSIEVAKSLCSFTKLLHLQWERKESPFLIGLFHDLCKADSYKKINDKWTWNQDEVMPGHAEKSIIMLQQFMILTEEEIMCIRWHMGAFDTKENWVYYNRAISMYNNVLWTHTADMVASKIVGI